MEKIGGNYKYYGGCGVYRTKGGDVEFYVGDGKWKKVDYDIDHALKWDENFMEITSQDSLNYEIDSWDENGD